MEPRDVIITSIIRPDLFWVIEKESAVRNEIENLKSEPERTSFKYDIGSMVMAKIKNRWCRVKLNILQHTQKGLVYKGFLIDYGTHELISSNNIRKVPFEFQNMDPQAIKIKVSGITASKRTMDFANQRIKFDYSRVWAHAAYTYLKKIVDNCSNTKIIPYEKISNDLFIADVIFQIFDHEVNFSQQLIQESFALPKDDNTWNNKEFIYFENSIILEKNSILKNESLSDNESFSEKKSIQLYKSNSKEMNNEEDEFISKASDKTDEEDFSQTDKDVAWENNESGEENENKTSSYLSLVNYQDFENDLTLKSVTNTSYKDLPTSDSNYSFKSYISNKNENNISQKERSKIADASNASFSPTNSNSSQRSNANTFFSADNFNSSHRPRDNINASFSDSDSSDKSYLPLENENINNIENNISHLGIGRGKIFIDSFSNANTNICQREIKRVSPYDSNSINPYIPNKNENNISQKEKANASFSPVNSNSSQRRSNDNAFSGDNSISSHRPKDNSNAPSSDSNSRENSENPKYFENNISHLGIGRGKIFIDSFSNADTNICQREIKRVSPYDSNSSDNSDFPHNIEKNISQLGRGKMVTDALSSTNSHISQIGIGREIVNASFSNTNSNIPHNTETSPPTRSTGRGKWFENLTQSVGHNTMQDSKRLLNDCKYIFIPAGRCLDDI